jgi:hypothetical protein
LILGPLLFLVFVNEMPDYVVNDMLTSADDTNLRVRMNHLEHTISPQDDDNVLLA